MLFNGCNDVYLILNKKIINTTNEIAHLSLMITGWYLLTMFLFNSSSKTFWGKENHKNCSYF